MDEYFPAIEACPLFLGMTKAELVPLIGCLSPSVQRLGKNEAALVSGERTAFIGLVASGLLEGARTDHTGRRTLMNTFVPGQVFGEILALSQGVASPVDVVAMRPSVVLRIAYKKLTSPCAMACPGHIKLIQNTMRIVGEQYFALHKKLFYLSKKSIRARAAAYLLDQAAGRAAFRAPLGRQAMAEYLRADRSALSRELAAMRRDGLISYHRDEFKILDEERLKGE